MTQQLNSSDPNSPLLGPIPDTGHGLKHSVPAWALSLLLHTTLFGVLILALTQVPSGASKVENRSGGIVLVDAKSESTEYLSDGDFEVEQNNNPTQTSDSPPPLAIENSPPDLPGIGESPAEITGAGTGLADALTGADSLIVSVEPGGKVGGKFTTEIFGVKGDGSRFVYVVDRSDSMAGFNFRPMLAVRQQLKESLNSLEKNHQFEIIFYNQETRVRGSGRPKLYYATDEMKQTAINFIDRTKPSGGTDHVNALKQAFRLRPDVIFLLTDAEGGFSDSQMREISRFNRSGTILNAIEFGQRRGRDRSLETVSRLTGGQYVFKNINTLRINDN